MISNETQAVMKALNHDDVNARFVGGCIRNELMQKPVKDIDIACKFTPEQTIETLQSAGIKTIPTGIQYGTVTAIINGKSFEITSLRSDTNTDGRHADVAFGASWVDDARRRDFTINALYADMDGHIYDPLGNGLNDIQNGTVRFIGNAVERIKEDYLRILRFFRFYGRYGNDIPDAESMDACIKLSSNIQTLSNERIADELTKIICNDRAAHSFYAMHDAKLFDYTPSDVDALSTLIPMQIQLQQVNINSRKYLFKDIYKYFNNNKLNNFINKLDDFLRWYNKDQKINQSLYLHSRETTVQGLLVLKSKGAPVSDMQIASAMSMTIPILPVTATDIMNYFKIKEGPMVGQYIKQAEDIWMDHDLNLKTHDILEKL